MQKKRKRQWQKQKPPLPLRTKTYRQGIGVLKKKHPIQEAPLQTCNYGPRTFYVWYLHRCMRELTTRIDCTRSVSPVFNDWQKHLLREVVCKSWSVWPMQLMYWRNGCPSRRLRSILVISRGRVPHMYSRSDFCTQTVLTKTVCLPVTSLMDSVCPRRGWPWVGFEGWNIEI